MGQARRDLTAALLAGEPAEELESPAGMRVAAGYVVCAWHVARPSPPGTARSTLVRRRRIWGAFDDRFDTTVLTVLDERGGTALIPATAGESASVLATLRCFLGELAGIVGAPMVASAAVAHSVSAVPDAAQEARGCCSSRCGWHVCRGCTCSTTWCWRFSWRGRVSPTTGWCSDWLRCGRGTSC
ncbi:MAG: hypothetical protein GEV00_08465 [Actinophytocola sp.]|nr:hypothetical protein [Actinophytocola sp.]